MIYFCEWKLKNDFGSAFRFLNTQLFWSLSRDISWDSFIFWSKSRDIFWDSFLFWSFPYMGPLSFFDRFVQKVIVSCFFFRFILSIFIAASDGSINVENNPSFYRKFSEKKLFVSANTFEKYIVYTDYCIVHYGDKTYFVPACNYHIILLGNGEELLKKLNTFRFTCQHVDCLYTMFEYRFSGKVIAKSGKVFDNVQRAVDFNRRNKGVGRMPGIAQKRLLRKKYKKAFIQLLLENKNNAN